MKIETYRVGILLWSKTSWEIIIHDELAHADQEAFGMRGGLSWTALLETLFESRLAKTILGSFLGKLSWEAILANAWVFVVGAVS